jgi:hypothetical protein
MIVEAIAARGGETSWTTARWTVTPALEIEPSSARAHKLPLIANSETQ